MTTEQTQEEKRKQDDYDNPWKDILQRYLPECLSFFFPELAKQIDWSKGYEFLDKELQQIAPKSALSDRAVDKLVKVFTKPASAKRGKGGKKKAEEMWILIHIEVQSQYDSQFTLRMYIYHYRIFDLYGQKVVSLAILGDERPSWRPNSYGYKVWECEVKLKFPIVKLLDYKKKSDELEASRNPFAVVVMAHLQTQETRHEPDKRFEFKWQLIRSLYERGYSKEDVRQLFHFIDWIMKLPEELEERLDQRIAVIEEEQKMPYITGIERRAMQRGVLQTTRENLIEVLKARFENVSLPETLVEMLKAINDSAILKRLLRHSATVESVPAFEQRLAEVTGGNVLKPETTAPANG